MNHLNHSILDSYDIALNAPDRTAAIQFGDSPLLMGLVDRLIDDANLDGLNLGVALVQCGAEGHAKLLKEQEGLYTVFVRGEENEQEVRREQVVQCVTSVYDPEADDDALLALARSAGVRFAILHEDETGEFSRRNETGSALLARMLVERWRAGFEGMAVIVCGDSTGCAARVRDRVAACADSWKPGEGFGPWLSSCRFFPALADCLVLRSSAEEAARLCAQMNYADGMIHLAEPFARWTIQADAEFCREFPLDAHCSKIAFTDDLSRALLKKQRLFDAGLFAMAALGCLHGDETLADCMRDEPLRELAGRALLDEILPFIPLPREEAAATVIESFARYENAMNDNRILDAAPGLLRKFNLGVLPAMRAYADEHFAAPQHLTLALAATVMLYSGARLSGGVYEVLLGDVPAAVHDDPESLAAFALLAPDMPADSLAYAALADRTLWHGADLREIDGLEELMAENMAMVRSIPGSAEE